MTMETQIIKYNFYYKNIRINGNITNKKINSLLYEYVKFVIYKYLDKIV